MLRSASRWRQIRACGAIWTRKFDPVAPAGEIEPLGGLLPASWAAAPTCDPGHVLRAGAAIGFLPAAPAVGREGRAIAHHQRADTGRTTDLVSGEAEMVDTEPGCTSTGTLPAA